MINWFIEKCVFIINLCTKYFVCSNVFLPVWIVSFGQIDWRGVLQSVSKRDYLRYICYLVEKGMTEMKKCSERIKKPVCNSTFIIDLEGLSMRQMGYKPCKLYFWILILRKENKIIKHSINLKSGKLGWKPLECWRLIILKTFPKPLSSTVGLHITRLLLSYYVTQFKNYNVSSIISPQAIHLCILHGETVPSAGDARQD